MRILSSDLGLMVIGPAIARKLLKQNSSGNVQEREREIKFTITADVSQPRARDILEEAKKTVEDIRPVPWQPLLGKIKKFRSLVMVMSEVSNSRTCDYLTLISKQVHPYAKLALGAIMAVSQVWLATFRLVPGS